MATMIFVQLWKEGDRLFVDVNGATMEARPLALEQQVVTLESRPRVVPPIRLTWQGAGRTASPVQSDPLHDECLW